MAKWERVHEGFAPACFPRRNSRLMWWQCWRGKKKEKEAQEELERVWDLLRARRASVWPVVAPEESSTSKRRSFFDRNRVTIDDFCLGKRIGKGSFGSVVLARKDDEVFAVKVVDKKKGNKRARKERVAMARLHHCDFTLTCRYAFQTFSKRYIVTDFYWGGSLEDQLSKARGHFFDKDRVLFHASELVLGIKGMHDHAVCHRDIKPSNILVDSRGHLVIGDFGFAKTDFLDGAMKTFCGTVEYMAPEVLRGEDYGLMVDWWAFGITLYEMLCGQTPFYHESPRKMFSKILAAILPQNSRSRVLTKSTLVTIYQLLQKNPMARCGYGQDDVTAAPFFSHVDFRRVRARAIEPPFAVDAPVSNLGGSTTTTTTTPSSPVDFESLRVVSF